VNIIHQTIGTSSSDSSAMQVDTTQNNEKNVQVFIPEKDAFVAYLAILHLHDQKEFVKGLSLSKTVLEAIQTINRRSMDIIASKISPQSFQVMKPIDKKKIMTMLATKKYKKYHAELIKMNVRQKLGIITYQYY
jgi:ethanolamine utilization microcompartment shell protein EutS